jgi:hypothetical protein
MNVERLLIYTPSPRPNLFAVEETRVDHNGDNGGETETILEGKGRAQEDRTIFFILLEIEREVLGENFSDFIWLSHIGVGGAVAEWEIVGVPFSREIDSSGNDPSKKDRADHGVGNGMPWSHEWAQCITGNHRPIQGEDGWWEQGHSAETSEQLVDENIVWLNPSNPRNGTQSLCSRSVLEP